MSAPDQHSLTWSLDNKQLVFSDDVLEIGQQVAILGIIKEITMFSGETARILTPVRNYLLLVGFFSAFFVQSLSQNFAFLIGH
jgi:hypothetical protein